MKKIVVIGDLHLPHVDYTLYDLFLSFLNDFKPDILVINGDLLDCTAISKFDKVPRPQGLRDELELGYKILSKFREILPEAEMYYIEGNHEFRLRQYLIRHAPELYEVSPTLEEYLKLGELKIEWIGTKPWASKWVDTYKQFGQLYIGHWDKVNKHSAYTAKALVEDKGISLIQNHVHRGGVYHKRLEDGKQLVGIENFCMCDLEPEYMGHANWQQGWTIIYSDLEGSGRFHAYPIPVIGYKFFWNSIIYEVPERPEAIKLKIEVL